MSQREKIMIVVALLVALVIGAPMVVSAFGSTDNTDRTIARLQTERREKEKTAQRMEAQTKTLEPQVQRLAWNVPPEQLRQEIVRKLSNLAAASNVTLVATRPLKPRPLDVLTEVTVEIHVTSTLPNLVKFLFPLQQSGSRFSVDRLRLAAANAETDLLDVDMSVSAYTLQVQEEATVTPPRSAAP